MLEYKKKEEISKHVKAIMDVLGIKETESTKGTPDRVAKMYVEEIFKNVNNDNKLDLDWSMTTFDVDTRGGSNEMILVKDIPFYSTCEHHLMPFSGKVTVGYVPNEKIIGLSKIPRVVKYFSKKPQLQERLAVEIADYLQGVLDSKALFVSITDCVHTCVSARGIETYCTTDSSQSRGYEAKEHYIEFITRTGR